MVTVKNYQLREGKDGKPPYITLELAGDIELVQSANTGRFYATCRKCFIYSTFDELIAKQMVGKQIPGTIARVNCDPYDYTISETGEVIKLAHTYTYLPEGNKVVGEPMVSQHQVV
jgi:hypothetical protein